MKTVKQELLKGFSLLASEQLKNVYLFNHFEDYARELQSDDNEIKKKSIGKLPITKS